MTWVRIDEEFARHPKVIEAGPLGMAMQVAGLCYCNQYLTDGFVPDAVVPALLNLDGLGMRVWKAELFGGGDDASWELVMEDVLEAGLWKKVAGGYRIHDFHKYQPSKAEVMALREARKDAGSKGGKASGRARTKQVLEQKPSNGSSKTEAKSNPVPVPVPGSTTLPTGASGTSSGTPASKDAVPEKGAHYVDPTKVCEHCGEDRGHGCLENCPTMAKPSVTLVVGSEPERVAPPPEFTAGLKTQLPVEVATP